MSRLALASKALQLSQQILAPVPVGVRVASIVQAFLRQAFTVDDVMLAIGIQALISMEKANTPGPIEGSTIEELRPFIKRNVLSKLKGPAKAIGGKIYNLSLAGKSRSIPLTMVEEAWHKYTETLQAHPIEGDKEVGQVIRFIANGFTMRLKDVLKVNKRREQIKLDPEVGEDAHGAGGAKPSDHAAWNEIERKFKQEKKLLGPNGEPFGWLYIDGKARGLTNAEIADAFNEASRAKGGDADFTDKRVVKWRQHPSSGGALEKLTKEFIDEDLAKKIRKAVNRGALNRAILAPFERELIELLA